MALQTKNWAVTSYTNDVWTDLVAEPATIAALVISTSVNTSMAIRVEDTATSVAVLVPLSLLDAGSSSVLDLRSINITGTQKIQVQAADGGVEFFASGVVEI